MAWNNIKQWFANMIPSADDFNRIEGNTLDNHERLNNIENGSSLGLGLNASTGISSVALGHDTSAGNNSVALGSNASAEVSSVALGRDASAGFYSVALGRDASAAGLYSVALGHDTSAAEHYSVALGYYTSAIGSSSVALGHNASATEDYSVALGHDTSAGNNSVALGSNASAEVSSVALGSNASAEVSSVALGRDASATGESSTALGHNASARAHHSVALGSNSFAGNSTVAVGDGASAILSSVALGRNALAIGDISTAIGLGASAENANEGILGGTGSSQTSTWKVPGSFTVSGTKNFEIPHPKPEKKATHVIRHGAVESPTPGDTLYRWKIQATKDNDLVTIDLPDYFVWLNKDVQIWVTGQGHFGNGYGTLNRETEQLEIHCQFAGEYNVLVIGTRNDDHESVQNWSIKGVEREIGESWTGETYAFSVDEILEVEEIKEVS